MKVIDKPQHTQIFVCCRERDGKPACGNKGAEDLVIALKNWVRSQKLQNNIGIARSSCLGHCQEGIAIHLSPQNKWLIESDMSDFETIKQYILQSISL